MAIKHWVAAAFAVVLAAGASTARAEEVGVFAAASTAEAVTEIGRLYAARGAGGIRASFASSAALAKQIENGAPAAVFISADERWMDYLGERKLVAASSRVDLLGNQLVLVAPKDSTLASIDIKPGMPIAAWLGDGRLAVGDPESVPAGTYAKAALVALGVWAAVEPHLAPAESVRAALAFVERGEAPLGVVYATDAAASAKVRVVGRFPAGSHPPVVYPAALVAGADTPAARAFFDYLKGPEAQAVFRGHGFTTP